MRDANHMDDEGCVSWERCALALLRAQAIAWMRDNGVERVDRVGHEQALAEAHAEFDRRHEQYIVDLIAHNERENAK